MLMLPKFNVGSMELRNITIVIKFIILRLANCSEKKENKRN